MQHQLGDSMSKELTDEIVNRGIAEFMGYVKQTLPCELEVKYKEDQYCDNSSYMVGASSFKYTKSLDKLIPVWEKLESYPVFDEYDMPLTEMLTEDKYLSINYVWAKESTLVKSAAYATYKAIQEIKE